MGVNNSKSQDLYRQFLTKFKIVKVSSNDDRKITYLQDIDEKEEDCICLEISLSNQDKFREEKKIANEKKQKLNNVHVVKLKQYFVAEKDHFCGVHRHMHIIFEYPHRTLNQEILERTNIKSRFSDKELWSIIASCILGMSELQKNNIKHECVSSEMILLDNKGVIKIADPYCTKQKTNYQKMIQKQKSQHFYLSPELCKSLDDVEIFPQNIDPYRSDVFTFGIVIMQAALLKYLDDCYRQQYRKINYQTVTYYLDKIGQIYNFQLKQMIQKLVTFEVSKRPNWLELKQIMKDDKEISVVSQKNSQNLSSIAANDNLQQNCYVSVYPNSQSSLKGGIHQQKSVVFQSYYQQEQILGRKPQITINSPNQINPFATKNNNNSLIQTIIVPVKPCDINFIRPSLRFDFEDNYVSKTRIDQNLASGQDQDNQFQSNQSQSNEASPYTVQTIPLTLNSMNPLANHNKTSNIIFSKEQNNSKYNKNITDYHININLLGNKQPKLNEITKTSSINSKNNNFKPVDTTNLFTNYEKLGLKKSVLNISEIQLNSNRNSYNSIIQKPQYRNNKRDYVLSQEKKYVVQTFNQGSRYEGQKLNGLRHGKGRFFYQDGGLYDGWWKDNKMNGQGKLFYQSGKIAYDGEWENDTFSGYGRLYNEQPQQLKTGYHYDDFDDIEQFWTKYEGYFIDDQKQGLGKLYFSNGQYYQGHFQSDNVDGEGVFHTYDGDEIRGIWKQNQLIRTYK